MFSSKTNHQYPILLCPDRWCEAIQNPSKIEFSLTKPQAPHQSNLPLQGQTIFFVALTVAIVVAGIFLQKKYDWLLPLGILFSIFSLPLIWKDYEDFQKQKRRSSKLKDRYERELAFYQSEYKKFLEIQKKTGELSQSELIKYKSISAIQNTVLPEEEKNFKIGLSERPFYNNYLVKYFGKERVLIDRCLPNDRSDRPYYPDFVVTLPDFRLYIDIEIDEPYTPLTENPKAKHYQGADDERDQYFLSKGWFVIRFSEQQIVEQPDSCCKFIAKFLCQVIPDCISLEPFNPFPDVKTQAQWTPQEAQKMIIRNERIKYLPKSIFNQGNSNKKEEAISDKVFTPSSYQTRIFEFIEKGNGNGLVNAVAGSGKSTTLIQAAKLLSTKNALFVAFNKSIAEELKKKLGSLMEAKTIHSLGLNIVKSHLKEITTDDKKYKTIVAKLCPETKAEVKFLLEQLINYSRYTLTNPNDREEMEIVAEHYNLDTTFFNQAFPYLISCLEKGKEIAQKDKVVDFTDMIWLPNVLQIEANTYDWMFVDECQDLSACQLELILKCLSDRGRILFVGDPHQSIYGFSGADCNSVEKIRSRVNATELPLSICYRCPSSHIALAKEIVPQIEAREDAPEGTIQNINQSLFFDLLRDDNDRKTLVIGRRTAPLINICLSLNQEGIKAVLKGGEIKQDLIDLVKRVGKMPGFNFDFFCKHLRIYRQERSDQIREGRSSKQQIEYLNDQVYSLESIFSRGDTKSIEELILDIEDNFRETKTSIILCTVHKAKGLEADRVFIIAPKEIPLVREGQKDWEKEQEMHLKYVALTRSKSELYFVNLD